MGLGMLGSVLRYGGLFASVVGVVAAGYVWWERLMTLWVPSNDAHLERLELKMLERSKCKIHTQRVEIREGVFLHTLRLEKDENSTHLHEVPLVLFHGFGGGSGLWARNVDVLAQTGRQVYCVDLLGFGRSSRPRFNGKEPIDAIKWWIEAIEAWREAMSIEKMVLLGHSLGGYVTGHYGLCYPDRVSGLILLSPFGVLPRVRDFRNMPMFFRFAKAVITHSSPFVLLRLFGPFGPRLMYRFRGHYDNARYDFGDNRVAEYAYHLTSIGAGSGDYAFMLLIDENGNAVLPFIDCIENLTVPFTVISGTHDSVTGHHVTDIEARSKVKCITFPIEGGGHHTYATHSEAFHEAVTKSLELMHS